MPGGQTTPLLSNESKEAKRNFQQSDSTIVTVSSASEEEKETKRTPLSCNSLFKCCEQTASIICDSPRVTFGVLVLLVGIVGVIGLIATDCMSSLSADKNNDTCNSTAGEVYGVMTGVSFLLGFCCLLARRCDNEANNDYRPRSP